MKADRKKCIYSPKNPDEMWGPASLLFPGVNGTRAKPTTHLHPMMLRRISPLPHTCLTAGA